LTVLLLVGNLGIKFSLRFCEDGLAGENEGNGESLWVVPFKKCV
jgi:hypothetical protein